MEHVSLTPEQMNTANKGCELLVFRNGLWYIVNKLPRGRELLSGDGILSVTTDPPSVHQHVYTGANYRGFFTDDKLHSFVLRTHDDDYILDTRQYYTQTYDPVLFKFSDRVESSSAEYYDPVRIGRLPYLSFLMEPGTGFSNIGVWVAKYDDSTVRWINTVIDQFNQLKALNETETA